MAYPSWPSGLPSPFAAGDPQREGGENEVLTTPMESGPPKVRRRFTSPVLGSKVKVAFRLTYAQRTTFWGFVDGTLSLVTPFLWRDFATGADRAYRFSGRPTERHAGGGDVVNGGGWWDVDAELTVVW